MKTTKEERILNMAKGFMNIYKVQKRFASNIWNHYD